MTTPAHWWDALEAEEKDRFGRALNDLVRNWMANRVQHRAGLHSKMSGEEALVRTSGYLSAPGAMQCFREVANKLGEQNTVEALILRDPHSALFPDRLLQKAAARLQTLSR